MERETMKETATETATDLVNSTTKNAMKGHYMLDLGNLMTEYPNYTVGGQVFVVYEVADEVYPAIVRRYVRSGYLSPMGVSCYNYSVMMVDVYTFAGKKPDRIWTQRMIEDKGYTLGVVKPMLGWFNLVNLFNGGNL